MVRPMLNRRTVLSGLVAAAVAPRSAFAAAPLMTPACYITTMLKPALTALWLLALLGFAAAQQAVSPPAGLEIVALGGQSNMDGGRRPDITENLLARPADRSFIFTLGNRWFSPAFDPIATTDDQYGGSAYPDVWPPDPRHGRSPAIFFANKWAELTPDGPPLGLVSIAKGGTAIIEHLPSTSPSTLFGAGISRLDIATRKGTLIGVLFSQGETDAKPEYCHTSNLWKIRFARIVAAWRKRYGEDLPIVFAQLGDVPRTGEMVPACWRVVKDQQAEAAQEIPNVRLIRTNGLPKQADEVHYTPESQRIIGERMADALFSLRKKIARHHAVKLHN